MAVVLAACDEQEHIGARIDNLLSQAYPPDKLTIYVGSDGSTDRTVPIVESIPSPRIHLFTFAERRGKSSVLNDIMAHITQPVTIFTDANVTFSPNAVALLARSLLAPAVGAACGELILGRSEGDNQDSMYWRIERFLKSAAGRIGALLGANGAIYAIRTELFEPLAPDTIIDDFVIPMRIANRNKETIYIPEALAWEDTPDRIDDEFIRRIRIGLGNYQTFFRYPQFLLGTSAIRASVYFFHKVVRWFGPQLLLIMLVTSAYLANRPLFAWLLWLQIGTYAALLAANVMRGYWSLPKWLSLLVLLANVNVAFLVAFWRYLLRDTQGHWTRTSRGARAGAHKSS